MGQSSTQPPDQPSGRSSAFSWLHPDAGTDNRATTRAEADEAVGRFHQRRGWTPSSEEEDR